jgi:hypothetical protein
MELVQMSRDSSPHPPPQMRNGGPPPAHLSTSSLSDPSGWLQYKWLQPPPRAPDWVIDDYKKFNPPANVGCPLHDKEWLQQSLHEDQQAAGMLPPKSSGGPILLGARARAERVYQDWKWAVDELWEQERHRLQTGSRQHLLDKRAAYERQEAARQEAACAAQCLLDEQAALECQEAMQYQRIFNKEAACRQRTALARQMAAARTIFLWLRRRRLHIRLARQTLQQQQREAALPRLRYEQDCCSRAALAEEQRQQAAAARAKALADEADERRRQDALAAEQ